MNVDLLYTRTWLSGCVYLVDTDNKLEVLMLMCRFRFEVILLVLIYLCYVSGLEWTLSIYQAFFLVLKIG